MERPGPLDCLLQAQSDVAAEHGMTLYKAVVRRLIHNSEGYECQEAEGSFMLVFHKPMRAVQFCLQVSSSTSTKHRMAASDRACRLSGYSQIALVKGRKLPLPAWHVIPTCLSAGFCVPKPRKAVLTRGTALLHGWSTTSADALQ